MIKSRNNGETTEMNDDEMRILIERLDKRVMKKFEYNDEKLKKLEDDIYKNKNEILNLKTGLEQNNKIQGQHHENIETIFIRLNEFEKKVNKSIDDLRTNSEANINNLIDDFEKKLQK